MQPSVITKKLLTDTGAVLTNSHFVFPSGNHGDTYINKAAVTMHPLVTSQLAHMLAEEIGLESPINVVVAAPAVGAIVIGSWLASHLTMLTRSPVNFVYVEKGAGSDFVLPPGYRDAVRGRSAVIAKGILSTGGSTAKLVQAVRRFDGHMVAVGAICNRGRVTAADLGVPRLVCLWDVQLSQWSEEDCPLCRQGVPINTKFGSGREFLSRQGAR